MGKKSGSGSGMNNSDHISGAYKPYFWIKILKFVWCGSGMEKIRTRDKHPGSATLIIRLYGTLSQTGFSRVSKPGTGIRIQKSKQWPPKQGKNKPILLLSRGWIGILSRGPELFVSGCHSGKSKIENKYYTAFFFPNNIKKNFLSVLSFCLFLGKNNLNLDFANNSSGSITVFN